MNRRTRTLQFFGTVDEVHGMVSALANGGLFVFAVKRGVLNAVDTMHVGGGQRLFIGEGPSVTTSAHREPARHGLVILDMPSESDGKLCMTNLSAVNAWIEDGIGRFDDRSLRLFDRVRRSIAQQFVGYVDVVGRSGETRRPATSIRITQGAATMSNSGVELIQRGVHGTRFVPHDEKLDGD